MELFKKILNGLIFLVILVLLYYGYQIFVEPPEDMVQRANLSIKSKYFFSILAILFLIKSRYRK
jgi:uncharacterized membrane protein YesL